jgi:virginiamycin B lyase
VLTKESTPSDITTGPDKNIWFVETLVGQIGRITLDGTVTEFALPTPASQAYNITTGPDGNLWFTYFVNDEGHGNFATITTEGIITGYPAIDYPSASVFTPDGSLWFANTINQIGRKATDGTITYFVPPTQFSDPSSIVLGPDNKMWFTESGANKIGRLNL